MLTFLSAAYMNYLRRKCFETSLLGEQNDFFFNFGHSCALFFFHQPHFSVLGVDVQRQTVFINHLMQQKASDQTQTN